MNDFYLHKVNDSLWDNYFYIHSHQKNIGKMSKGENFTLDDETILNMFNQKEKSVRAIKQQYQDLFLRQIIDTQERELVSESFRDNSVDSILYNINKSMNEELNRLIRTDLPNNLVKIKENTKWDTNALQRLIDGSKKEEDLLALDDVLTSLGKAVKIIESKKGKEIASILIDNRTEGIGLSEYGALLWKKLDEKEKELKGNTIKTDQLKEAIGELKKIAKRFENKTKGGTTNKNESPLTGNIIKSFTNQHFFSTVLGELLARSINTSVLKKSQKIFIDNPIKDIQGSGRNTYSIVKTNIKGELDPNSSINTTLAPGKADARFDNFTIDLTEELGKDETILITLGFGISVKTYQAKKFGGEKKNNQKLIIGSGDTLSLSEAINLILNTNYKRYVAYNIFAHEGEQGNSKKTSQRLQNLQDSVFTRSLIYTFSSRGLKNENTSIDDFAMFILANGKLINIWDIIQYIENINLGIRTIRDKYVSFSISGITNFKGYFNKDKYNFKTRTAGINDEIKKSKISAHLDVLNFVNYISKKRENLTK